MSLTLARNLHGLCHHSSLIWLQCMLLGPPVILSCKSCNWHASTSPLCIFWVDVRTCHEPLLQGGNHVLHQLWVHIEQGLYV